MSKTDLLLQMHSRGPELRGFRGARPLFGGGVHRIGNVLISARMELP